MKTKRLWMSAHVLANMLAVALVTALAWAPVSQADEMPIVPQNNVPQPPLKIPNIPPVSEYEVYLKSSVKAELSFLDVNFTRFYAPIDWKKQHIKWDPAAELAKGMKAIDEAKSIYDFRRAIISYLKSTQDYHVGFTFNTDEAASLPFFVRTSGDATLVVDVDPSKLNPYLNDLVPGSRILELDGVPIKRVLENLKNEIGRNIPATDQALVDLALTNRQASEGMRVPKGSVKITFQTLDSPDKKYAQLVWDYREATIPDVEPHPELMEGKMATVKIPGGGTFKVPPVEMISSVAKAFVGNHPFDMGSRNSFLGYLGNPIWPSSDDSYFQSYMFRDDSGRMIGFIRIPNYTPDDVNKATADFMELIDRLEANTDALIIDQLNNPGGYLYWVYTLASMLTDKPLSLPKNRVALTDGTMNMCRKILQSSNYIHSDLEARAVWGPAYMGYPVTWQFHKTAENSCRFLVREKLQGKLISGPTYLHGFDQINPFPGPRYTKPIVILINELDFSGGDWFPTIMKENKRALLVGTRTAGAGGYVDSFRFNSSIGLTRVTMTGSLAVKEDGTPIENLGATPDVELVVTPSDYLTQFAPYKSKLKNILRFKVFNGK